MVATDAEATSLAKRLFDADIKDSRVCFTPGEGHISGKVNVVAATVSFYASGGVDLSGSTPKISNLKLQLGGVPNLGPIQSQAEKMINDAVNQSLAEIPLKKRYSINFGAGNVTVREITP